jgi:hypothetical protein
MILLSVVILLIVLIIYFSFRIVFPNYENNVLNRIKFYQNWQWINPAPSNGEVNIPFVFKILPNNQVQISYYDGAGYLKGFSTYILDYSIIDTNTLNLQLNKVIANYSKSQQTFPWHIKYIDDKNIVIDTGKISRMLTII